MQPGARGRSPVRGAPEISCSGLFGIRAPAPGMHGSIPGFSGRRRPSSRVAAGVRSESPVRGVPKISCLVGGVSRCAGVPRARRSMMVRVHGRSPPVGAGRSRISVSLVGSGPVRRGRSSSASTSSASGWADPPPCGELWRCADGAAAGAGRSPRVPGVIRAGTHVGAAAVGRCSACAGCGRSIPVCAGGGFFVVAGGRVPPPGFPPHTEFGRRRRPPGSVYVAGLFPALAAWASCCRLSDFIAHG